MGKGYLKIILLLLIVAVGSLFLIVKIKNQNLKNNAIPMFPINQENADQSRPNQDNNAADQSRPDASGNADTSFLQPLDDASQRVTKKPFGIYVSPKNSPVQPEKFQGYHTGTDFETFQKEADTDVNVNAICDGKLLVKRFASGYGGVVVESCLLDGNPITVVYGHLKLESVTSKAGDDIKAGNKLGILGNGFSKETDGERKHLHLGIHRGAEVNILGYVQTKSALSDWIDPCQYICGK